MLDVGVQTKGIVTEQTIDSGYLKIANAGFDRVDFNLDSYLKNSEIYGSKLNHFFDQTEEELTEIFIKHRDAMRKNGLRPSQMHAPYPVLIKGKTEQNKYIAQQVIPKSFMIANLLEVPYMVIHPIKLQGQVSMSYEIEQNLLFFESLIPLIHQYNVKVCMENLYEGFGNRIIEGVCGNPKKAVYMLDELNEKAGEELFGICLDSGHMNLVHRQPYDMITTLGKRIKVLHLHDNDGRADIHQMPYTYGAEGVDWPEVLRGLKDVGFEGTLSFETYPCVNSFPKVMQEQVLKQLEQTGRYWARELQPDL